MKPEETIDFHLRWTWAKISKMYNAEAAKFGGTMAIGFALLNIDKEGTPSTKLGPKMGMEPTSLTRLLKTMEQEKLIHKTPSETDKRIVLIRLTEKGKRMRDQSRARVIAFNELVRKEIPEEDLETFMRVMQSVNALLERNNIFEEPQ
ncbi:MAG TPA: MarR family transcriptional regulator [Flavobacteriales bacterium]